MFGATEKRFVEQKQLVTPGPGNYNPLSCINMLDSKSEANIKRSSSMFLSAANRENRQAIKATNQNPPVGQYDINQYDMNTVMQRKAESGVNNPAISNLKMKRGDKDVFISGTTRFQAKKVPETETYIGPGLYEV